VLGPPAFAAAWALLGATTDGYDPTRDAISRLAALGAPTRPAMTAGLVALGLGMSMYGLALRPLRSWPLPVANGMTALAVAALPLGGAHDTAHGIAASLGYVTLVAIPLAAARLIRSGRSDVPGGTQVQPDRLRVGLSVAVGAVSGLCLLASALDARHGLLQRLGLTVTHVWVVVSAVGLLRSPRSSSTTPPAPAPGRPPR
jgi:hypothetical protein